MMAEPPEEHPASPAGGAEAEYLAFVAELAPRADLWLAMLDEHVPDEDGFCRSRYCGRGGYGTPCVRWPCPTRLLADRARKVHQRTSGQDAAAHDGRATSERLCIDPPTDQ